MNKDELANIMLEEIFIKTGGRPENVQISEICAQIALNHIPQQSNNNENWISPIKSEADMQEQMLKKIFSDYPDSAFKWQYLNALIQLAFLQLELQK